MSARSALTVVGQAVGYYYGGQWGAAIGGMIGGAIGGAIDGPVRNSQALIDDLGAVKFDYGAAWPRMYGQYRFKVSPMWSSTKRPVEHEEEVDEKGGPAAVNTSFTYEQDWWCWAPQGATGFARVWRNGELIFSALAASDNDTLAASLDTPAWGSITFFDGNAAQMPWTVYEAAVGTGNAVAMRHRPTLAIGSLDLGPSGQPPLIEVEFFTAATESVGGFEETFDAGLTPYMPFGGPVDVFSIGGGIAGAGLTITGGAATAFSEMIIRDVVTSTFTQASLKFRVDTTDTDDLTINAPYCSVNYTGGRSFAFSPSREKFYDAYQRATLYFDIGDPGHFVSDGAIEVGVWHELDVQIISSSLCRATLRYVGGTVLKTTDIAGSFAPWTCETLSFYDQSVVTSGIKPGVTYDEITLGTPGTKYDPQTVSLADIVRSEALLEWTGEDGALSVDDIDVTALEDIEVTGFATVGSPRESIAQLADWFYFGCRCSNILDFPLRGAASIDTVAFEDTGMAVGQPGEPFTGVARGNDLEVAIQTAVTGPNLLTDYDPGTENSDRLVGESVELRRYTTPVVATPSERKGRADTMVYDGRVAANAGRISLDDRHVEKEPFDVWGVYDEQGTLYNVRSDRMTYADGVHDHDVVLDDASVLSSVGITTETDSRAITVAAIPLTTVVPLDIPNLEGEAISRGLYVAAKPASTSGWAGYKFYESPDDVAYTALGTGTKATVIGTCSVVPGNFAGGRVFDEFDSIVVDVGTGTLSASTRDAIIADQTVNAFAIGVHGRWLLGQFRDAVLQGSDPNVYELRGLVLGSLGTEQHIGTQVVGDTFVLLKSTGGVIRVPQKPIDQGALRYYKGVSIGRSIESAAFDTITQQEVGLMPLSPWNLSIARDVSGNATITGLRRTRLATRYTGPSAPIFPIGEESELYSLDIFTDGTRTSVVRSLSSSTLSFSYAAAEQTTDFGSPQSTLYVTAYQLSASVGRGFPALKAA